uniref:Uncharacterized protein n=1 Tax=Arundo donax TaxID=35708 RepID=A0A0A8Z076_ARUDO
MPRVCLIMLTPLIHQGSQIPLYQVWLSNEYPSPA